MFDFSNHVIFGEVHFPHIQTPRMLKWLMFTEHLLVADDMSGRTFKFRRKDPTWQALCRYFSILLYEGIKVRFASPEYRSAVAKIAAGAVLRERHGPNLFPYPSSSQNGEPLAPRVMLPLIVIGLDEGRLSGRIASKRRLSDKTFRAQMQTRPEPDLKLAKVTNQKDNIEFLIADDGHLKSALPLCKEFESEHPGKTAPRIKTIMRDLPTSKKQLTSFLTDEENNDIFCNLWLRWLRDSVLKQKIRDLVYSDVRVPWRDIFAARFPTCISTPEQAFVVLIAILRRIWPEDLAQSFNDHLNAHFPAEHLRKIVRQTPETLLAKAPKPLGELSVYRL
jgi:hypothetical protein